MSRFGFSLWVSDPICETNPALLFRIGQITALTSNMSLVSYPPQGRHSVNQENRHFLQSSQTPKIKRPSVNCAKDWLDFSFLSPVLVWSEKQFHFGCDYQGAVNNHFPVYWSIFGMVTNEQTNDQPGDPRASLLVTSVRRQSFAIFEYMITK